MDRYDLTVDIERDAASVWDFVTDLGRTPLWRTTICTIEPPDELRIGAPFAGTTRLLGRTWNWQLEITNVEPPRHFAYTVTRGVAAPTVEYLVEPRESGTRFTMSGHIDQMSPIARVLKPLALPALRRETRVHLANLMSLLEESPGATDPTQNV